MSSFTKLLHSCVQISKMLRFQAVVVDVDEGDQVEAVLEDDLLHASRHDVVRLRCDVDAEGVVLDEDSGASSAFVRVRIKEGGVGP